MISEEECKKIIEKSLKTKKFQLIKFDIEKASEDNIGYLGEYYKLIIEIEGENNNLPHQLKYFVKTIPQTNLEHKRIIEEIGVFKKEGRVYSLFQEWENFNVPKFHPECFLVRPDLIVLEDLTITGYHQILDKEYNLNELKGILRALACLHSCSLAYEIKKGIKIGDELKNELFETSVTKDVSWFLAGLEAIKFAASKHPKFQLENYQNFIKNKFMEKMDPVCEMVNPSSKYRNVLSHRDSWGQNIFFKNEISANNNSINEFNSILVDFQTCRYCPPAIDILFLLHLNVSMTERNKIYTECLKYYHQMLEKYLLDLEIPREHYITYEEIVRSCHDLKLFGCVYDCIAATIVKLPKGYLTKLKLEQPKKYFQFSNVNRNNVVEEFLERDEHFKNYLFDAVEELLDVIYSN